MSDTNTARRRLLVHWSAIAGLAALGELPAAGQAESKPPLRIGYQKYGTLILLKARGSLESRLGPLGVEVRWSEFPAGPQLLEGLNVGSIDFGTVGEAPPIFAQAAGANQPILGVGDQGFEFARPSRHECPAAGRRLRL